MQKWQAGQATGSRHHRQSLQKKPGEKSAGNGGGLLQGDGTGGAVDHRREHGRSFNFRRIFQTITVDNGSEFQDWEGMTRTVTGEGDRTHIYYCHPYSAYERGSNENGNRMIRRRVPKGTDFTGITEADTLEVQRWVNEYPRGILGGRCAGRVLLELAQEAGIEGVELLL